MKSFRNFYAAILFALLTVATLNACGTMGYENIDTTRKAIVAANAEIRGANFLLQDLVQRNVISDADARDALASLREAHGALQSGLNAIDAAGDPVTGQNALDRANAAIGIAITLLAAYTGDP